MCQRRLSSARSSNTTLLPPTPERNQPVKVAASSSIQQLPAHPEDPAENPNPEQQPLETQPPPLIEIEIDDDSKEKHINTAESIRPSPPPFYDFNNDQPPLIEIELDDDSKAKPANAAESMVPPPLIPPPLRLFDDDNDQHPSLIEIEPDDDSKTKPANAVESMIPPPLRLLAGDNDQPPPLIERGLDDDSKIRPTNSTDSMIPPPLRLFAGGNDQPPPLIEIELDDDSKTKPANSVEPMRPSPSRLYDGDDDKQSFVPIRISLSVKSVSEQSIPGKSPSVKSNSGKKISGKSVSRKSGSRKSDLRKSIPKKSPSVKSTSGRSISAKSISAFSTSSMDDLANLMFGNVDKISDQQIDSFHEQSNRSSVLEKDSTPPTPVDDRIMKMASSPPRKRHRPRASLSVNAHSLGAPQTDAIRHPSSAKMPSLGLICSSTTATAPSTPTSTSRRTIKTKDLTAKPLPPLPLATVREHDYIASEKAMKRKTAKKTKTGNRHYASKPLPVPPSSRQAKMAADGAMSQKQPHPKDNIAVSRALGGRPSRSRSRSGSKVRARSHRARSRSRSRSRSRHGSRSRSRTTVRTNKTGTKSNNADYGSDKGIITIVNGTALKRIRIPRFYSRESLQQQHDHDVRNGYGKHFDEEMIELLLESHARALERRLP